MFRTSSSTTSTFLPTRASSERCSRSSIFCFFGRQVGDTRCRNRAVSSSRRSGDSTPLTTTLRASTRRRASSSGDSSLPVKTTTGKSLSSACRAGAPALRSRTCREGADRAPRNRTALAAAASASAPVVAQSRRRCRRTEQFATLSCSRDCPPRPAAACGAASAYSLMRVNAASSLRAWSAW
jgi:hypothetical protein